MSTETVNPTPSINSETNEPKPLVPAPTPTNGVPNTAAPPLTPAPTPVRAQAAPTQIDEVATQPVVDEAETQTVAPPVENRIQETKPENVATNTAAAPAPSATPTTPVAAKPSTTAVVSGPSAPTVPAASPQAPPQITPRPIPATPPKTAKPENTPQTETTSSLKWVGRVAGFIGATALMWAGYFAWRPPAPMLFLRHSEHMGESNRVSLTFDDAPHPLSTPLLLAALKRSDVKGTFFVVGEGLRVYPELSYRMVKEGHALANHSENHRNLTRVPVNEYDIEVGNCFKRMEELGQKTRLFRPPGGGLNRAVMQHLYDHDYTLAWWSNNIGDWSRPPAWKIVNQVNSGMKPGDIVLLHDAGIGTAQALPLIVRRAREEGIEFVTMPE